MFVNSYSSFINLTKKILLCVSIFLVVLIFSNRIDNNGAKVKNTNSDTNEDIQQIISNPKFISSDAENRPYTLQARQAKKITKNLQIYELSYPEGTLIEDNGGFFNVKSLDGIFNQETEILSLKNSVILKNQDGYIFKTESASIDLNAEIIYSDNQIIGTGPKGNIKSQGFSINDKGKVVFFTGKSKLILENK
tara:strand:- start:4926 stop:5504 length:579 start_codon:yes stop_codon:yes gene_type:complete